MLGQVKSKAALLQRQRELEGVVWVGACAIMQLRQCPKGGSNLLGMLPRLRGGAIHDTGAGS